MSALDVDVNILITGVAFDVSPNENVIILSILILIQLKLVHNITLLIEKVMRKILAQHQAM